MWAMHSIWWRDESESWWRPRLSATPRYLSSTKLNSPCQPSCLLPLLSSPAWPPLLASTFPRRCCSSLIHSHSCLDATPRNRCPTSRRVGTPHARCQNGEIITTTSWPVSWPGSPPPPPLPPLRHARCPDGRLGIDTTAASSLCLCPPPLPLFATIRGLDPSPRG